MNLVTAIFELMRRPGTIALAPPLRMIGFNDTGHLMQLGGKKPDYARLNVKDFMREDFEVVTPEQLAELAKQNQGGEG
jgi:hypothetical protein